MQQVLYHERSNKQNKLYFPIKVNSIWFQQTKWSNGDLEKKLWNEAALNCKLELEVNICRKRDYKQLELPIN